MIHGWIDNALKFGVAYGFDTAWPNQHKIELMSHWLALNPSGTYDEYLTERREHGK